MTVTGLRIIVGEKSTYIINIEKNLEFIIEII